VGLNTETNQQQPLPATVEKAKDVSVNTAERSITDWRTGRIAKGIAVFFKRCIRKCLRWYINPVIEQQNVFNECVVQMLAQNNAAIEYCLKRLNVSCDISLLEESKGVDYIEFENRFRGPRELIKERHRQFVEYFIDSEGPVLDIGCGRGEFLELLRDYEIPGYGIDLYKPSVTYCTDLGLAAEQRDALTYLNRLGDESIGGIFMSQVAEHLSPDYLTALLETIYKKIKNGAYFIFDTPDPENITTYRSFYTDLTHNKPVHPATMEYLLRKNSFSYVEKVSPPYARFEFKITPVAGEGEETKIINEDINKINEYIFNTLDYVMIARK
jgi:O-antigen chain-terminating methyltransferase